MNAMYLKVSALNNLGPHLRTRGRFIQGNSIITCDEAVLEEVCNVLSVPRGSDTASTFGNLVSQLQQDENTVMLYLRTYNPQVLEDDQNSASQP